MFFEINIKSSGLKGPFNTAPVAESGGPYAGNVGEPTSFNGSESFDPDGDELTYKWDFGDGETGSGETPDHTYDAPGTYNVTLTVSDGALFSISKTTIKIGEVLTDDYDQDGTPDSEDDDDDNDGLNDEKEEEIGSDPKNPDDVIKLEIGDNEYYLIDTDEDGEIDTIYNPQLGTYGPIEQEDNNIVIDTDGDGEVDYYYNQLSGQTTIYEKETKEKEKLPLMLITGIIAAIVVILLIVIYLFKTGYLYLEKK
jgi:PKD repeat protein